MLILLVIGKYEPKLYVLLTLHLCTIL